MSAKSTDELAYSKQACSEGYSNNKLNRQYQHAARFYQFLLQNYLPENKNGQILDLPCGEGRLLYALRHLGYKNLCGYDLDSKRIQVGTHLNLPLLSGDVFSILEACQDGSVQGIFSIDFLEHLEKEQVVDWINLVYRKLAPGGRFYVRTPCADSPFGLRDIHNDFTHKWAATSGVLRRLFEACGFTNVVVFGEHPKLGMSWGLLRVPLFRFTTFAANLFLLALGQKHNIWSPSMWGIGSR